MKTLIIGATGMLAKPVIECMANNSFKLKLFSRTINNSQINGKFEIAKGNVFHEKELTNAIRGCDAIHINLSKTDEASAVNAIVQSAKRNGIKLISYLSGCTVSEENRWFSMIDNKYKAEQKIINSGIPYLIFKPTWFLESLPLMIRNGKAVIFGKQPNKFRWIAASDYARMVVRAYESAHIRNKFFYVYGNESLYMSEVLQKYCQCIYPEIKTITTIPIGLARLIALIPGKKDLKYAASLFSYFEKVKEPYNSDEINKILGKPELDFDSWLSKCAK